MKSIRLSSIALIAANTVPLFGVLLFDWSVYGVLMLYWVENVVIGVINVCRMIVANRAAAQTAQAYPIPDKVGLFLIPFFAVHYGGFCFGHYMTVQTLFDETPWLPGMWLAIGAIAVSHILSFFINYIGQGEYRRTNASVLMARPYGRIILLHVTVIAGAFLMQMLGDEIWMLVVLVGLKTAIDLGFHRKERAVFGNESASMAAE